VLGNSDFQLSMGPTNGTHTYASTLVTRGWIRALNSDAISTGPLSLDVAGGLRLNGNNLTVASLTDVASGLVTGNGAQVENSHGSVAATLTVGTDNSTATFNGVFNDGGAAPLGLTKAGSGTLTLTGDSTNTGPVTVNGGTMALSQYIGSGSFGSAAQIVVGSGAVLDVTGRADGTLTLNSGQTLKGNGTVTGVVSASAGSTVSPGGSVGTLTVSGNVTLNGLLLMELNRTNAQTADRLISGGTITYGGSLLVTNIGPALQVNDTFQVFPSGVTGFGANIAIASTDATGNTYTWQNDIGTLGSVKVLGVTSPVNPNPTNIVAIVSSGSLNLSWPEDHIGWSLQAQTNGLSVGLSNNWTTLGYEGTNEVTIPIDAVNPAVFYRLFYSAP
jgi:autotransporter-associated beta strand protein